MLPCKTCAYRKSVPGSAHIRCTFDWISLDGKEIGSMLDSVTSLPDETKAKIMARADEFAQLFASVPPNAMQWFRFPINYDPVWGPKQCPQRADAADPLTTRTEYGALLELFGLFR